MGGLSIGALHNHYLFENPRVIFAHVEGSGDAAVVAMAIRAALQQTGNVISPHSSSGTGLAAATIGTTLGGKTEISQGVVHQTINRTDSFMLFGAAVPAEMGAQSMVSVQQVAGGQAMFAFEIAALPKELPAVMALLRVNGIQITGVHNHAVSMQPPLFYIHASAVGDSGAIAATIRAALDRTSAQTSGSSSKP